MGTATTATQDSQPEHSKERQSGGEGGFEWMRAAQGTSRHWIDRPAKNRGKEKVDPPPFRLDTGTLAYVSKVFPSCNLDSFRFHHTQQSPSATFHYHFLIICPVQGYEARIPYGLSKFCIPCKGLHDNPASCRSAAFGAEAQTFA